MQQVLGLSYPRRADFCVTGAFNMGTENCKKVGTEYSISVLPQMVVCTPTITQVRMPYLRAVTTTRAKSLCYLAFLAGTSENSKKNI